MQELVFGLSPILQRSVGFAPRRAIEADEVGPQRNVVVGRGRYLRGCAAAPLSSPDTSL